MKKRFLDRKMAIVVVLLVCCVALALWGGLPHKVNRQLHLYTMAGGIDEEDKIKVSCSYWASIVGGEKMSKPNIQLEFEAGSQQFELVESYVVNGIAHYNGFGYCKEHNQMEPCQVFTQEDDYDVLIIHTEHDGYFYAVNNRLSVENIEEMIKNIEAGRLDFFKGISYNHTQ